MSFYKKPWFYIPVALVLIIAIIFVVMIWPNGKVPARISTVSGDVQVNLGSGYVAAQQDQLLKQGASIKTGNDASAVVVLYDSVLVRLASNTEISIDELSQKNQLLQQNSGAVWTKVTKLGGVEEFKIQTPTTTATVRGTTLETMAKPYKLLVGEGIVVAGEGELSFNVSSGEVLEKTGDGYIKRNMTPEERKELKEQLGLEISTLRDLRLREIKKNDMIMSIIQSRYHSTDEQIAQYLKDIDDGVQTDEELRSQVGSIPSAAPIFAYNAEIKKIIEHIALLQS